MSRYIINQPSLVKDKFSFSLKEKIKWQVQNHKSQPITDKNRKSKDAQTNTRKTNKRTESIQTSSFFPNQDNDRKDNDKTWQNQI